MSVSAATYKTLLEKLETLIGLMQANATVGTVIVDSNGVANKIIDNKIRVSSSPYTYDVAEGNIPNHNQYTKLGYLGGLGSTSEVDLWTVGGKYVFPTAPMQMEVIGGANDTALGTGIRTVRIGYLDANYVSKNETLTMDGVTPVHTVAEDIYRVNSIRAVTVGSTKAAVGTINLRNLAGTPIYRSISPGFTRGRGLIYTVPASTTIYLTDMHLSGVNPSAGHYTRFILRANYDDQLNMKIDFFQPYGEIFLQDQALAVVFSSPIRVPATCDLVMSCIGDNANTLVTGVLRGWSETS